MPDKAVSVSTPPTSPSLIKKPVKAFVPVIVKVVLTPTAKVVVVVGESVVVPSFTENPPIASDPLVIVVAEMCGSPLIASIPASQLPTFEGKARTEVQRVAVIKRRWNRDFISMLS